METHAEGDVQWGHDATGAGAERAPMSGSARGPRRRLTPERRRTSRREPLATLGSAKRKKSRLEQVLQAGRTPKRRGAVRDVGPDQGDELEATLGVMARHRRQRRRDLALVRSFFEDPMRFLMRATEVRTPESRAARERQLRERLEALRALLDMMEGEMRLLVQAEVERAPAAAQAPAGPVEG